MHQPGGSTEFVSTSNTGEVLRLLVSLQQEVSQLDGTRIEQDSDACLGDMSFKTCVAFEFEPTHGTNNW